ncbi:MAG: hypothetical protein Q9177_003523, partial [Variospora cf. flavescens]
DHPQHNSSRLPETSDKTPHVRRKPYTDLNNCRRGVLEVVRRDYIRIHAPCTSEIDGAATVVGQISKWQGCFEEAFGASLTEGFGAGVV